MADPARYSIHTDVRFGPMAKIEVQALVDDCREAWFNQSLCRVNDCVVRLGIVEGEFHWHKHDQEDEFFFVIEGRLLVDFEGRTIDLGEKQGLMVSRGVLHRTRAPRRTVILMIEGASVKPTGD